MLAYELNAMTAAETPEERLDLLTEQLHYIAIAASQAKARGDDVDLANLIALLRKVSLEANALRLQANRAGQPSAFLMQLDKFSDAVLGTAREIGSAAVDAVSGTLTGIGAVSRLLPIVLVGALVILGMGVKRGTIRARFG